MEQLLQHFHNTKPKLENFGNVGNVGNFIEQVSTFWGMQFLIL
jgi:hypothetical protein